MYCIPKEQKYTAELWSINNEAQCLPLLFLSLRFMTYVPYCILGKLFPEKTPLNLGSSLKYLLISILFKGWSGSENVHLHLFLFLQKKLLVLLMKRQRC